MKPSLPINSLKYWLTVLVVGAAYFLTAKLGMLLATVQGNVTLLWPPAGIALAALILGGWRLFPAIMLASLAATATTGAPWQLTLATALGNPAASLAGLGLLHWWGMERSLERVRDIMLLLIWGGLASSLVGAAAGAAGLLWAGMVPPDLWTTPFLTWWLGDSIGVMTVTPLVLYWALRPPSMPQRPRVLELLSWSMAAVVAAVGVFGDLLPLHLTHMLLFVAFPLLLWAALRFGSPLTATCVLVVCHGAVIATAAGIGPFLENQFFGGQVLLWAYLASLATTSLALASAMEQLRQSALRLSRHRDELAQAVERRTAQLVSAHQELWQSHQRTQSILDSISDGFFTLDNNLVITYFNPAAERLVKRRAQEVLGLAFAKAFPEAAGSFLERQYQLAVREKKLLAFETFFEHEPYRNWFDVRVYPSDSGASVFFRVTTEQKKAALALNRSEERLRTLVEESPLGVAVISPQGEYLYINSQFTQIFGYKLSEVPSGQQWFRLAFPDPYYRREVLAAWERDLAASQVGQARPRTYQVACKNGEVKFIEFRPVTLSTGEQLVIYEDASQRERALRALRASEEKFQKLYMASPAWMNLTTMEDGRYLEVNDAFSQVTGYSRQEAIGKTSVELGIWKDPSVRKTIRHLMRRDGFIHSFPVSFKMKDGQVRHFLWSAERVNIGPEPLMISVHLDVTELRRAQEALAQSEEQYRLLVNNLQDAVYSLQDGKFVFTNPEVERITGYSGRELRAMDFRQLIHPDHLEEVSQRYADRLAGNPAPDNYPIRLVTKGGIDRWIQVKGNVITWQGRPAVLYTARDITLQRAMEAQLRQSQKLEAVGTLAGGIAHDFNNLLAAIMGYAELSLDLTPPGGELTDNLEQILKAGERGRGLVQQLLSFSRGAEREMELLDLPELINEALKLLRAAIPSNITIETRLAACGPVRGDPVQLHQLLMNLVTNAAQAMEETGGVISLSLERVEVTRMEAGRLSGMMAGPHLRLRVSDTGPGIPPELRERIFEPFFTTKEAGKGSGLGLAAVHGIVQSHQGAITLLEHPGPGTTFQVLLPEEQRNLPSARRDDLPPSPSGSERILFVDDEPSLVEVGRHILTRLGYRVSAFSSSQEALKTFKSDPWSFDLVISDQTMPGITGAALAQEIKALRPDIPVIITSGFSHHLSAERAAQLGVAAFVLKPITSREIARVVRRALDEAASGAAPDA